MSFDRTESVAEKMLTNWFTFLLYKFLKVSLNIQPGLEKVANVKVKISCTLKDRMKSRKSTNTTTDTTEYYLRKSLKVNDLKYISDITNTFLALNVLKSIDSIITIIIIINRTKERL